MDEKTLEKHFEKRLETILKVHSELLIKEKNLSPIWKMNELNKIGEMLNIARGKTYTVEEMDKIEREDMGYGR